MAEGGHDTRKDSAPFEERRASALETLYRRYSGWLGNTLSSRLRSTPIEVDDIVQETYVRVARYAPEDAERHPQALLMRIAVNLARDHMRKNVVRGGLAAGDDEEMARIPVEPDQHHQLVLKQIVLDLPPIYRDVFVLSRFTGLTYEEIACHVGISVKTVEWRMSRAIAMCIAGMQDEKRGVHERDG